MTTDEIAIALSHFLVDLNKAIQIPDRYLGITCRKSVIEVRSADNKLILKSTHCQTLEEFYSFATNICLGFSGVEDE